MENPILEIQNLSVEYFGKGRNVPALRNVSLSLRRGETLGIAGESGCGKSTLALAILGLIAPHEGRIVSGKILFEGRDLLGLSGEELRNVRGRDIGIVFQDPFTSLNPVLRIGDQIDEAVAAHFPDAAPADIRARSLEGLVRVQLKDPERIYESYPHQVSGGQRQRAMIAMAVANRPKILIADEPTTALDVTVQKEILELLASLQKNLDMAILFITHHIGIIAGYTQELAVLYAGEIMEMGRTEDVIRESQHPYTLSLLKSIPKPAPFPSGRKNRLFVIQGAPPDLTQLPEGCIFHPRCPIAEGECRIKPPVLRVLEAHRRKVSCHLSPIEKYRIGP